MKSPLRLKHVIGLVLISSGCVPVAEGGDGRKGVEGGPFELATGKRPTLRVYADESVIEVFANDRRAVIRRIYPKRKDSLGVVLFSRGAPAAVHRLQTLTRCRQIHG